MDKMNLYKCAQALSVEIEIVLWLGNRVCWLFQVGKWLGIDGYYRYALPANGLIAQAPQSFSSLSCDSIESINTDLDCAHRLPGFWLNRDQLPSFLL